MSFRPKIWTSLGLGIALVGLAACGGEGGEVTEAGEAGETVVEQAAGERGEAGAQDGTLSLPNRLAFMSGHVEAGLALYRAGEPEMAAPHLLHPVSETHAAEREGLDVLGFEAALFETVADALEAGTAADQIEPQLLAAEANLASVIEAAGGDAMETIEFLMDIVAAEYAVGVPGDTVEVAGEYQDAYGFAIVARKRAAALEGTAGERVRAEIETLIGLWPDAPVPPETPTLASAIIAQTGLVRLELSALK